MGYEDLLQAINKQSRRRCERCQRSFKPANQDQEFCSSCLALYAETLAEPDPAKVGCPNCVHGKPEPASWCGWVCGASKALNCQPGKLNALMVSKGDTQ